MDWLRQTTGQDAPVCIPNKFILVAAAFIPRVKGLCGGHQGCAWSVKKWVNPKLARFPNERHVANPPATSFLTGGLGVDLCIGIRQRKVPNLGQPDLLDPLRRCLGFLWDRLLWVCRRLCMGGNA